MDGRRTCSRDVGRPKVGFWIGHSGEEHWRCRSPGETGEEDKNICKAVQKSLKNDSPKAKTS
jgi:hypothetical protein